MAELSFASGESSLSVRRFSVSEAVSVLFEAVLEAVSPDEDLDLEALVGDAAALRIPGALGEPGRLFRGVVRAMEQVRVEAISMDLAAKKADCRAYSIGAPRSREVLMIRILSTLRALHGSVQRCTYRTLLPLVLALLSVLSGAACRDDQVDAPRGTDIALDDSDASPVAGAIQGSFAVSSTGEATYVLPLIVPPGAAGMQPTLAIAYNSAAGDGMLGMGFSLSGLSAITRCPRTMAQDNQIRSVRYDQHDALCLGRRPPRAGGQQRRWSGRVSNDS